MKGSITLKFKPLFAAMGEIGKVSRPEQADLQAWVLCSEWVLR